VVLICVVVVYEMNLDCKRSFICFGTRISNYTISHGANPFLKKVKILGPRFLVI
jgi:hypothetical protein